MEMVNEQSNAVEGWRAVKGSQLATVSQVAERQPGLSYGGLQYLMFKRGKELEGEGIAIRFGRRVLLDEVRLIEWLRAGNGRKIRGGDE